MQLIVIDEEKKTNSGQAAYDWRLVVLPDESERIGRVREELGRLLDQILHRVRARQVDVVRTAATRRVRHVLDDANEVGRGQHVKAVVYGGHERSTLVDAGRCVVLATVAVGGGGGCGGGDGGARIAWRHGRRRDGGGGDRRRSGRQRRRERAHVLGGDETRLELFDRPTLVLV